MIHQKYEFLANVDDPEFENKYVEYIEDCFEDMPRRMFGWSVKVTLMEEDPCTFDTENNPDLPKCIVTSPRTGDSNDQQTAQERQTGEGFRSAAPADCRVSYICDTPPNSSYFLNQ